MVLLVRAPWSSMHGPWVHAKWILGTSSGEVEETPGVTGVSGWATSTLGERRDIIIKRLKGKGYPDMTLKSNLPHQTNDLLNSRGTAETCTEGITIETFLDMAYSSNSFKSRVLTNSQSNATSPSASIWFMTHFRQMLVSSKINHNSSSLCLRWPQITHKTPVFIVFSVQLFNRHCCTIISISVFRNSLLLVV